MTIQGKVTFKSCTKKVDMIDTLQGPRSDKNVQLDNEVQLINCEFVIIKDLNHDVILGVNTLRALQFTMGRDDIKVGPDKLSICQVAAWA